jgi:hypothetical protein
MGPLSALRSAAPGGSLMSGSRRGSRLISGRVVPEVVPHRFRAVPAVVPACRLPTGSRRRNPKGLRYEREQRNQAGQERLNGSRSLPTHPSSCIVVAEAAARTARQAAAGQAESRAPAAEGGRTEHPEKQGVLTQSCHNRAVIRVSAERPHALRASGRLLDPRSRAARWA